MRRSCIYSLDELLTVLARFSVAWLGNLSFFRILAIFARLVVKTVFQTIELPGREKVGGRVVVFQSMVRPDYDELVDNIVQALGDEAVLVRLELQNFRRGNYSSEARINFRRCIPRLLVFAGTLMKFFRLYAAGWSQRGFVEATFLYLYFIKIRIDLADLVRFNPRHMVVFAEMQPLDRLISMMCREHGIRCFTMQHGLYAEYTKIDTVNRFNYQPLFVSDFLAWGENTARLVSRYKPDVKITVCGKPTLVDPVCPSEDDDYDVVVIMDQNIFQDQNQAMLDMVSEVFASSSHRKGLRLHPRNELSDYQVDGFEVVEGDEWLKTKLCVGHTTSFLVDILQVGIPVARYNSGAETVFEDKRIEFTSSLQLQELLVGNLPQPDDVLNDFVLQRGMPAIQAHKEAILG